MGSIGDVVRGIPLAVRIKRDLPDTHVAWAIEPKSKGILDGHPAIDELIVFDRQNGFPAFLDFLGRIRRGKFDTVLDLQRHFKSGITSLSSLAWRRIGFHPRNAKEFNWLFNTSYVPFAPSSFSKGLHYQFFGDKLGLAPMEPLDFGEMFSEDEKRRALDALDREVSRHAHQGSQLAGIAAMIVGSSWESKQWPPERFAALALRLVAERNVASVLVGGPGERAAADAILSRTGTAPVFDLTGKTSLRELAALISVSTFAVGCDSGPMHIAAAVGTPVISLWGPTNPFRSGPYQNEANALQSTIGCAPCERRVCPGLDKLCMFDIPVDAVLARIRSVRPH